MLVRNPIERGLPVGGQAGQVALDRRQKSFL